MVSFDDYQRDPVTRVDCVTVHLFFNIAKDNLQALYQSDCHVHLKTIV